MDTERLDIADHFITHGALDRLWIMDRRIVAVGSSLARQHFVALFAVDLTRHQGDEQGRGG